jgi:hypothetical protein
VNVLIALLATVFQFLPISAPTTIWNPTPDMVAVQTNEGYYLVLPFQAVQTKALDWINAPTGVLAWSTYDDAAFASSRPKTSWALRADDHTGIAIYNPGPDPTTVTLRFFTNDGTAGNAATVSIPPGRIAMWAGYLLGGLLPILGAPGTVMVSAAGPISIIGARCDPKCVAVPAQ